MASKTTSNKTKAVFLENVKADFAQRIIQGYASVFGVLDSYGEIVDAGAFANTLAAGRIIKARFQHEHPVGKIISASEDGYGLFVTMLISKTARGDEMLTLAADGVLALSIGYREIAGYKAADGWHISEIELREVSGVDLPACEPAVITAVKDTNDLNPEDEEAPELKELHDILHAVKGLDVSNIDLSSVDRQLLDDAARSLASVVEASELPADDEVVRMYASTIIKKLGGKHV